VRLALFLALLALPAAARPATPDTAPPARDWTFALYLDGYRQSGEQSYLIPTVFADRGSLHLEARYNYEDRYTGSVFAGWSFAFGDEETSFFKLTPMVGGVFGRTGGIAPGLEVEARWWRLGYWLEGEYLFDLRDSSGSFLYSWSELDLYALPWLWFGVSVQRQRFIETETVVDVGPALGFGKPGSPGWTLSFYAYGLARSSPWYLATLAVQL
jgi:hypothetical protein